MQTRKHVTRFPCVTSAHRLTLLTSHTMSELSLLPVASMRPSGENWQNHTSSQCSFRICSVVHGNISLETAP